MENRSWDSGRYTYIERLGEGATKEVFLARDENLQRDVALCTFKPFMLSDGYIDRVQREVRTLARLNHPNIVGIFDFCDDDDGSYMITEYVGGGDLKSKMKSEWKDSPDLGEALKVAAEVADALSFAHVSGVFHRDVKPSNVMLTPEGTAKLGDFGLAKPIREDSIREESISVTGIIEGTIPYMSPEQTKGLPPDSPSDMYSFGIMLYEMVVGRRPFQGEDVTVFMNHQISLPPPPTHFLPTCPPWLEKLILELLDKEPAARPNAVQTAEELRSIPVEQPGNQPEPPLHGVDKPKPDQPIKEGRVLGPIQYPSTIVPLFITALALVLLILALPGVPAIASIIVAAGAASIATVSFTWKFASYNQEYAVPPPNETDPLVEWCDTLRTGFTSIRSTEGVKALNRLVNEFEQLQELAKRWPESSIVSIGQIGQIRALAEQTYRQGLTVLNSALELLLAVRQSDKRELETEIAALESEIQEMAEDESQAARLEIRKKKRSALKEGLELLSRQELHAEESLLEANLSELALQRTRIDLTSLRADSLEADVNAVSESLQRTIDQARDMLDEMRGLGF